MNDIVVRFPRPFAIILLITGVPVFVFLALMGIWMTISMPVLAGKFPVWAAVAACVIFPAMVVFSVASAHFCVRYGKESLFTTFRFSEQGIHIENSRYHSLLISWSDLESVTYSRSLKILLLRSTKLVAPIAVSQWQNFPEAVQLSRQQMGGRWVEKWL